VIRNGVRMTVIWLSPALPVDRAEIAALLGERHTVAAQTDFPPRGSLAVAGSDERELLAVLAARPADISLLLVAPSGGEVPREVAEQVHAEDVGTISAEGDAADLIAAAAARRQAATVWPGYTGAAGAGSAAGAEAGKAAEGRPRVQLVASALVAIAIIVAAVLVVTNGNDSSAAANGGPVAAAGEPGGAGGNAESGLAGGGAGGPNLTTAQITTLVACLKKEGVNVPSGTTSLPQLDLSNATVRSAMRSCAAGLGLGGANGFGGAPGGPGRAGAEGGPRGAVASGRPAAATAA
jgi:hypothetical protein